MSKSVFTAYQSEAWPYRFAATLHVERLVGGTPTDPNVALGWIKSKLAATDDLVRELVATTMAERGVDAAVAAAEVAKNKNLNGFKRNGGLYIDGRQVKAAIKEAAAVCLSEKKLPDRWGSTAKGLKGFVAEHIMVEDVHVPLMREDALVTQPDDVQQRFVVSRHGTSIQYEEYVDECDLSFTVVTDHDFAEREWAMLWLTGQFQGIGASRSQGFGRYTVTRWDVL